MVMAAVFAAEQEATHRLANGHVQTVEARPETRVATARVGALGQCILTAFPV